MTDPIQQNVQKSAEYIRNKIGKKPPDTAVVLGSGLGNFVNHLTDTITIPMEDIPEYPKPTVEGHAGKIVVGTVTDEKSSHSTRVCTFQGRTHFYECGDIQKVLYPIYVMNALGVKNLLVTNAAGGINKQFTAGDLMIIRDQINFTFKRPVNTQTQDTREHKNSIPLYDNDMADLIQSAALENKIKIQNGIYAGVIGPSYETPAEIQMLSNLGADAIGMSTVLESTQANLFGMRVAGISCITNMAAGISAEKLSHDDVTITAARVNKTFITLLQSLLTHPEWQS